MSEFPTDDAGWPAEGIAPYRPGVTNDEDEASDGPNGGE